MARRAGRCRIASARGASDSSDGCVRRGPGRPWNSQLRRIHRRQADLRLSVWLNSCLSARRVAAAPGTSVRAPAGLPIQVGLRFLQLLAEVTTDHLVACKNLTGLRKQPFRIGELRLLDKTIGQRNLSLGKPG